MLKQFYGLKERAVQAELMDDHTLGGAELQEALRHLRRLNRLFAASPPTLFGVERLWRDANKPSRLTILDVGAGSGDVNRRLLRWAKMQGIQLEILLVDITEEACEEARQLYQEEPNVQVKRCSLFELPAGVADIVTGTQFLHHFANEELPMTVDSMLQASRLGVVINDIHRHWVAWAAVWLSARLLSNNRYIRHDGPLSVAKGFRIGEWEELRRAMSLSNMFYAWRPLFRYVVVINKNQNTTSE